MKVAAVVVTWNRRVLLERCLEALAAQTRALDAIHVIDNASDDGTEAVLSSRAERDPRITVHRLLVNSGGAGGFHAGLAAAHAAGADWIWMMDDDTIPTATALEKLLVALESYPASHRPWLLASRVDWEDGRLHPMNHVAVKQRFHKEFLWASAARGHLSIRSATFVSLLCDRRCVDHYGLPLADYFIWNDDVEYTARILRHQPGIGVPASVVLHATRTPYGTHDAAPDRYYFFLRNQMWMLLWSDSHDRMEKVQILQMWLLKSAQYFLRRCWRPAVWRCYLRAAWAFLARRPRRQGEPPSCDVFPFVDRPIHTP